VCAILTVNTPQIIAAVVVLSIHWNDPDICDSGHTRRWKFWAAISAYRMLIYSILVLFSHAFKPWLDVRPRYQNFVNSSKNMADAFGLIWFIVGNMWLFGDDGQLGCHHPERSPVYGLCVSMLIINYVQICLPCIVAIMMIPIFCFCMPCLIRVLARLQVNRGTTQVRRRVYDGR
jgi:E3 ubiquitin-protein ligase RNF38/44